MHPDFARLLVGDGVSDGELAFGPAWRVERTLDDGTPLTLRPVTPDDRAELARAIRHLSPETRMRRFLSAVTEPSEDVLRYLTCVDQDMHVAIAATVPTPDMKEERGVGIARFVRLQDRPDAAEAAVTVVDDMQGKGVGRHLLTELAHIAWDKGVRCFRAEVLASNAPMRAILTQVGARLVEQEGDVVVFEVDLEGEPADRAVGRLRELLRGAATSMAGLIRRMMPDSVLLRASDGAAAPEDEREGERDDSAERAE